MDDRAVEPLSQNHDQIRARLHLEPLRCLGLTRNLRYPLALSAARGSTSLLAALAPRAASSSLYANFRRRSSLPRIARSRTELSPYSNALALIPSRLRTRPCRLPALHFKHWGSRRFSVHARLCRHALCTSITLLSRAQVASCKYERSLCWMRRRSSSCRSGRSLEGPPSRLTTILSYPGRLIRSHLTSLSCRLNS